MATRGAALGLIGLANALKGGLEGYQAEQTRKEKLSKEESTSVHQKKLEDLAAGKTIEPNTPAMQEIYKRANLPVPTGKTVDAQEATAARALAVQQGNPALAETKRHNKILEEQGLAKTKAEKQPAQS